MQVDLARACMNAGVIGGDHFDQSKICLQLDGRFLFGQPHVQVALILAWFDKSASYIKVAWDVLTCPRCLKTGVNRG